MTNTECREENVSGARQHCMDWIHRDGTRIRLDIRIEPGNNDDLEMIFDGFCEDLYSVLFVKQDE